jgi:hypothetical protein
LLGFQEGQQALAILGARGALLHPFHQGLRFCRTGSERFEAFDQLLSHHRGIQVAITRARQLALRRDVADPMLDVKRVDRKHSQQRNEWEIDNREKIR